MNNVTIIMDGIIKIVIILCASGLMIQVIDWIVDSVDKKEEK